MASRIEDYALIGDCLSAALVGTADKGRWLIAPRDGKARVSRRYRTNTLVLETLFETDEGAARLIDFMPIGGRNPTVVRLVVGERGRVAMRLELVLRFGFGA